jgi:hypothetical protein
MAPFAATFLTYLPLAADMADSSGRSLYPPILMVLMCCWAVLGAGLIAAWPHIRRAVLPAGESKYVGLALAGILLLAIAMRLLLSPLEPMLSTYSGLGHVADAYKVAAFDWSAQFQSAYPLTVQALAGAVMTVLGRSPEVFFQVVGAISLLMIPALYTIGYLLWGRPHEGLLAALFAALFPPFILFSTTGSLALPYASLGTVSIALLLLWLRTGKTTVLVTLLTALLLTLQTRMEAALFIVPVLATAGLYRQRLAWQELLTGRAVSITIAFSVIALPYLANTLGAISSELSDGAAGIGGMASFVAWSTLVLAIFYGWGVHHDRRSLGSLCWGSICLGAAYLITTQLLDNTWGLSNCFPGSEYLYTIPGADTFAPVGMMFIEPLLTPAGLTLAYLAAFATLNITKARSKWLLLNAWLVPVFGATLIKATGELPFCGARTALAAAPPFLLLAAAGATFAVTSLQSALTKNWMRVAATATIAIAIGGTFVAPLVATSSGPFNQQQEYHFVRSWISTLPANSILAYNNSLITPDNTGTCGGQSKSPNPGITGRIGELYRTDGFFSSLLGDNLSGTIPYALDTPDSLRESSFEHPVYYYEGLDCWRTGKPEMMPICNEIRRLHNLEEVATVEFENRLYGSDFLESLRIDRERVRLTLFRVLPR